MLLVDGVLELAKFNLSSQDVIIFDKMGLELKSSSNHYIGFPVGISIDCVAGLSNSHGEVECQPFA